MQATALLAFFAAAVAAWPSNFSPNCTTSTIVNAKGPFSPAIGHYLIDYPAVCSGADLIDTVCYVGFGHQGPAVTAIQSHLSACYEKELASDGDFGPLTEAALREVQADLGFKGDDVDGIWGPNTAAKMDFHAISLKGSECRKAAA